MACVHLARQRDVAGAQCRMVSGSVATTSRSWRTLIAHGTARAIRVGGGSSAKLPSVAIDEITSMLCTPRGDRSVRSRQLLRLSQHRCTAVMRHARERSRIHSLSA